MNRISWLTVAIGRSRFFTVAVIGIAVVGIAISIATDQAIAESMKPRAIVAAGLGYQDPDSSSITVKTYDAQSGEVLSSETYELDINEDGPPSSQPRSRIFAGGVGAGKEGLSQFTLRVYDASNGRFLWEGSLNLGTGLDPDVAAFPVVAQVQPRRAVVKVSAQTKTSGQPYFVLRAMNPETGQLVWEDQFFADAANVKVERINRSVIGMLGEVPSDIDFRIMMPDEAGRQLLWQDKVVPSIDEAAAGPERSDDNGGLIPALPQVLGQFAGKAGV